MKEQMNETLTWFQHNGYRWLYWVNHWSVECIELANHRIVKTVIDNGDRTIQRLRLINPVETDDVAAQVVQSPTNSISI